MKLPESAYYRLENSEDVIQELVESIYVRLSANQSVLWLVSGGSNIHAAVEIQKRLIEHCSLERLTIGLIDERYGPRGHADSNWQQLRTAGWNENAGTMLEVLKEPAIDLAQTTKEYGIALESANNSCDETIALFGIGADGHTAGILPNSSIVESTFGVDSYTGPDYQRISITPAWFQNIDTGVVMAFGESKKQALEDAFHDGSVAEIPARALTTIEPLMVYTDNRLDLGE